MRGETPSRDDIQYLSETLNLKENQIYKWFWDTKKKVEEDTKLASQINMSGKERRSQFRKLNRGSKSGGTIGHSIDGLLRPPQDKPCIGVDGKDGRGE